LDNEGGKAERGDMTGQARGRRQQQGSLTGGQTMTDKLDELTPENRQRVHAMALYAIENPKHVHELDVLFSEIGMTPEEICRHLLTGKLQ
jgi:hypothetical protein